MDSKPAYCSSDFQKAIDDIIRDLCKLKYDIESGSVDEKAARAKSSEMEDALAIIYLCEFDYLNSHILPIIESSAMEDADNKIDEMLELTMFVSDSLFDMSDRLQSKGEVGARSVRALADRVGVEYQRLDIMMKCTASGPMVSELELQVRQAKEDAAEAMSNIEKITKDSEKKVDEVRKKYERESITVLGILAAVVLVFNGAVSFSTSTIGATAGHHPFSIGFVVLLIGTVLFNCICALFTFLRITTKDDGQETWPKEMKDTYVWINVALVTVLIILFIIIVSAYWI